MFICRRGPSPWSGARHLRQPRHLAQVEAVLAGKVALEEVQHAPLDAFLRNEHGSVALELAAVSVCFVPSLRALYEAAEARWKSAQHQSLVDLFERACAETSHENVRAALNALLR